MSELPGPMTPSQTQTIGGLYAETFLPTSAPKGVVVITHGYMEHCGRYREVAHVIVNSGWAALAYDVRGHGHSPGERGYIDAFSTYVSDLHAMIAAARALAPGGPVVLLGHSNGGLITMRAMTSDTPPDVRAAIVSSPFLALKLPVPAWRKAAARVASKLAPKLPQREKLRVDHLTSDRAKQAEREADTLCFDHATPRWYTEMSEAQAYVLAHAGRVRVPTTWLVGGDDPIADPARSRTVASKVPGATYHDLVGLRHEVFNEADRARVFEKLTEALAGMLASA